MLKDTLLVTICLILSSVLGFIAQIVFASSFGASVEMDIYFKIVSVPAIVTGISAIIFSSVLIPTFAKFKSERAELRKFINSIWIWILVFGISFIIIGFVVSVLNIDFFIPENTDYMRYLGIQVSLMVWIGSGFAIMSSYLSSILNYNKQFFKVSLTSILPALCMIIFVLIFRNELGVRSISLGFCIAFILQFIILYKASKISLISPILSIKQIPYKKLLLNQSFLVTLSLLPFTILAPIAYFWASELETGSISYLGYSQSFAGFLSVAVSMGISIVALPELADRFANDEGESSLHQFEQSLRYVLLLAIFAAGVMITLRLPILNLFYQRGSFDSESVINLSSVLPWYLLAAVFIGGLNLLRTLFYSRGEFNSIAKLGLVVPIIFFILAGILKEKLSFVGIGIAYSITFAFLFFMTVFLAKKEELNFLTNNFFIFILKNIISVVISGFLASYALMSVLNTSSDIVSIFVGLFIFLFGYICSSKFVFKLKEIEYIQIMLLSKFK